MNRFIGSILGLGANFKKYIEILISKIEGLILIGLEKLENLVGIVVEQIEALNLMELWKEIINNNILWELTYNVLREVNYNVFLEVNYNVFFEVDYKQLWAKIVELLVLVNKNVLNEYINYDFIVDIITLIVVWIIFLSIIIIIWSIIKNKKIVQKLGVTPLVYIVNMEDNFNSIFPTQTFNSLRRHLLDDYLMLEVPILDKKLYHNLEKLRYYLEITSPDTFILNSKKYLGVTYNNINNLSSSDFVITHYSNLFPELVREQLINVKRWYFTNNVLETNEFKDYMCKWVYRYNNYLHYFTNEKPYRSDTSIAYLDWINIEKIAFDFSKFDEVLENNMNGTLTLELESEFNNLDHSHIWEYFQIHNLQTEFLTSGIDLNIILYLIIIGIIYNVIKYILKNKNNITISGILNQIVHFDKEELLKNVNVKNNTLKNKKVIKNIVIKNIVNKIKSKVKNNKFLSLILSEIVWYEDLNTIDYDMLRRENLTYQSFISLRDSLNNSGLMNEENITKGRYNRLNLLRYHLKLESPESFFERCEEIFKVKIEIPLNNNKYEILTTYYSNLFPELMREKLLLIKSMCFKYNEYNDNAFNIFMNKWVNEYNKYAYKFVNHKTVTTDSINIVTENKILFHRIASLSDMVKTPDVYKDYSHVLEYLKYKEESNINDIWTSGIDLNIIVFLICIGIIYNIINYIRKNWRLILKNNKNLSIILSQIVTFDNSKEFNIHSNTLNKLRNLMVDDDLMNNIEIKNDKSYQHLEYILYYLNLTQTKDFFKNCKENLGIIFENPWNFTPYEFMQRFYPNLFPETIRSELEGKKWEYFYKNNLTSSQFYNYMESWINWSNRYRHYFKHEELSPIIGETEIRQYEKIDIKNIATNFEEWHAGIIRPEVNYDHIIDYINIKTQYVDLETLLLNGIDLNFILYITVISILLYIIKNIYKYIKNKKIILSTSLFGLIKLNKKEEKQVDSIIEIKHPSNEIIDVNISYENYLKFLRETEIQNNYSNNFYEKNKELINSVKDQLLPNSDPERNNIELEKTIIKLCGVNSEAVDVLNKVNLKNLNNIDWSNFNNLDPDIEVLKQMGITDSIIEDYILESNIYEDMFNTEFIIIISIFGVLNILYELYKLYKTKIIKYYIFNINYPFFSNSFSLNLTTHKNIENLSSEEIYEINKNKSGKILKSSEERLLEQIKYKEMWEINREQFEYNYRLNKELKLEEQLIIKDNNEELKENKKHNKFMLGFLPFLLLSNSYIVILDNVKEKIYNLYFNIIEGKYDDPMIMLENEETLNTIVEEERDKINYWYRDRYANFNGVGRLHYDSEELEKDELSGWFDFEGNDEEEGTKEYMHKCMKKRLLGNSFMPLILVFNFRNKIKENIMKLIVKIKSIMKKIIFNFLIKILIGILMLIISSHFTEIINILPSIYASSWSLEKYLKYLLPDYYLDDKPLPSLPNEELRRIRNIDMPRATGLNSEMIKSNEVHKFLIKGELVDSLDVENYNKNLELFNRTKYLIKNRYPGLSERSLNKKVEEAIRLYNNDPTWIENLINSNKLWFKDLFDGKLPIFKKIFNNPIGSEELPLIDNRERIFRKAGIRNNELDQIVNPTRNILTQLKDYKKKLRDTGEDSIWRDY